MDSSSGLAKRSDFAVNTAAHWEDEFQNDDPENGIFTRSTPPSGSLGIAVGVGGTASATTATTIAAVTIVILLAIGVVFALGVFIDYRQQKIQEQKQIGAIKKRKTRLRLPRCRRVQDDGLSIAGGAEGPGYSRPPLETIAEIV